MKRSLFTQENSSMNKQLIKKAAANAGRVMMVSGLTACGGGSSSDGDDPIAPGGETPTDSSLKSVTIDASAGGFGAAADDPTNKYTYFNFDRGEVVDLSDSDAETSNDWHIAFKRTNIRLNGGVSGPAEVSGAVADAQDEYYDSDDEPVASVFLNVTPDAELSSLDAVITDDGLTYELDRNEPKIVGDGGDESWFSYNTTTHAITANADVWNIVRGASGGSYAKVRATNILQADREITLELEIQGTGETAFDVNPVQWTASIGADGGSLCYDFDTRAELVCAENESDWDLQLEVSADGRSWNMWTNGGIKGEGADGARFGPVSTEEISTYASAADVPGFFKDEPSGVFVDHDWYTYNLQGQHKLYPNYRVYIVDTGSEKYKFQITSYYHPEEGTSGVLSLRYAPLDQ